MAFASQDFVPIKEVRDGAIVLKDGSLRALLLTSSINLALKSEDEQNALILQFQSFLNSLEFPVQITIQSRRIDIRPYIASLEARIPELKEELLQIQTREYMQFIQWFNSQINIMTKSFVIVVPYVSAGIDSKNKGVVGGIKNALQFASTKPKAIDGQEEFEQQRSQLEQRVSVVEGGLSRLGVRTAKLGSQELIELYYQIFNPGESTHAVLESTS